MRRERLPGRLCLGAVVGSSVAEADAVFDSDGFVMLSSTAKKLGVKTIADMNKVKSRPRQSPRCS